MKKEIKNHPHIPNFILPNMQIMQHFQGTMRDFSTRLAPGSSPVRHALNTQDFLIIDNETGEIIKA